MKRFFYVLLFTLIILTPAYANVETAESIYAKGYSYIYKSSPKLAINIFKKGIASYPDCSFLHAGIGDAYLKEGNFQKAMEYYTTAQKLKYSIDNYKLDFYNASIQKTQNDINNALNEIISATKYSDNDILYKNINFIMNENYDKTLFIPDLYFIEGLSDNISSKNKDAELKEYLKVLAANPTSFQAANNAGVTLIYLKDYQLAEKYLRQALANNQNSAIILNNLAIVCIYLYKYNEAENLFREALKAKSDYIPAINNKSIAKIHTGLSQYQSNNITSILDIAKKDSDNIYAWRILSSIYFLKGDYKNAYNLLNQFESDYNFSLYRQKAYNAFKTRNYNNALAEIDKAISLYSKDYKYYELKGRILYATGDIISARAILRQAVDKSATNTTTNYYLAKILYATGDVVNANNIMCEFLSSHNGECISEKLNILFE